MNPTTTTLRGPGRTRVPLQEAQFVSVQEGIRMYYYPFPEGEAFSFMALELKGEESPDAWTSRHSLLSCLVQGRASGNGVQHLLFGHEDSGNADRMIDPDLGALQNVLEVLSHLVLVSSVVREEEEREYAAA